MAENVGGIVWTAEMQTENLVNATRDVLSAADKAGAAFTDMEKKTLKLTDATNTLSLKFQAAQNTLGEYIAQQVLLGRTITDTGKVLDAEGNELTDVSNRLKVLTNEFARANKQMNAVNTTASKLTKTAQGVSKATGGMSRNFGMAGVQVQQFVGQIQGGQSALLALSQQGADLGIVLGAAGLGAAVGIAATAFSFLLPLLEGASADVEELKDRISALGDSTEKTVNQIKFLANENSKAADELSKDNDKIAKSIIEKQKEIEKMTTGGAGLDRTDYFFIPKTAEQNQARYAERIKETREELQTLRAKLDTNNQEIIKLGESTQELGKKTKDTEDAEERLTQALTKQLIALEDGRTASIRYAAAQALNLKAGEQLPPQIESIIQAIEKETAAKVAQGEQDKKNLELARSIAAFKKQEENERSKLEGVASGTSGLTDVQALEQQYETERQLLLDAQAAGVESKISYEERLTELQRQYAEQRKQITQSEVDNQGFLSESMSDSLGAIGTAMGNFASVAREGGKESFKQYKAMATAQAIISTVLAINKALALGPVLGPIMATSIGAMGFANVAKIQNQQYGGGRQYGGPVNAGQMYEVGESNLPEIYQSGGKQYMIPGNRGAVISNKDLSQNNIGNVSVSMPMTFYGDVDKQKARNMLFDNEDIIFNIVRTAKNRRGK